MKPHVGPASYVTTCEAPGCDFAPESANAVGLAAQHSTRYGHELRVVVTRTLIFGVEQGELGLALIEETAPT